MRETTAPHHAANLGRDTISDALLDLGATDIESAVERATLLHMAVDYAEMEIARWLLDRGIDPNVRAAVDADGFGRHTPLFSAVVSQANYRINQHGLDDDAPYARLLLDRGADPNVRASLRKKIHPGYFEDTLREYRDVTPLSWGERFHFPMLVSRAALRVVEERGGGR